MQDPINKESDSFQLLRQYLKEQLKQKNNYKNDKTHNYKQTIYHKKTQLAKIDHNEISDRVYQNNKINIIDGMHLDSFVMF